MHTNIAPTCFGLRPSSGSLYWTWLKLYIKTLGKITSYMLFGDVAACHRAACILPSVLIYNFSQVQYRLPDDGRWPKYVGAIFVCVLM
jgi:hypothetical protein